MSHGTHMGYPHNAHMGSHHMGPTWPKRHLPIWLPHDDVFYIRMGRYDFVHVGPTWGPSSVPMWDPYARFVAFLAILAVYAPNRYQTVPLGIRHFKSKADSVKKKTPFMWGSYGHPFRAHVGPICGIWVILLIS